MESSHSLHGRWFKVILFLFWVAMEWMVSKLFGAVGRVGDKHCQLGNDKIVDTGGRKVEWTLERGDKDAELRVRASVEPEDPHACLLWEPASLRA